jgi:hypothetical protein
MQRLEVDQGFKIECQHRCPLQKIKARLRQSGSTWTTSDPDDVANLDSLLPKRQSPIDQHSKGSRTMPKVRLDASCHV